MTPPRRRGRPTIAQIIAGAERAGVGAYIRAVAGELEGRRDEAAWSAFGTILAQAHVLATLAGIASMRERLRLPDVPRGTRQAFSREAFAVPWDESKHPRGQPENAGQFAPSGGGSSAGSEGPSPELVAALKERQKAIDEKQGRVEAAKEKVKAQIAAVAEEASGDKVLGHPSLASRPLDVLADTSPDQSILDRLKEAYERGFSPWADRKGIEETLRKYTGSAYDEWNTVLRACPEMKVECMEEHGLDHDRALLKQLNSFLVRSKLDKPIRVFRGFNAGRNDDARKLVDHMTAGDVIKMGGFVSTSVDPKVAYGLISHASQEDGAIFEIEAKTGAYISGGTFGDREHEFLQPHGIQYEVVEVTKMQTAGGDFKKLIRMREL